MLVAVGFIAASVPAAARPASIPCARFGRNDDDATGSAVTSTPAFGREAIVDAVLTFMAGHPQQELDEIRADLEQQIARRVRPPSRRSAGG